MLERIMAAKRYEVEKLKREMPSDILPPRSEGFAFCDALRRGEGRPRLIAEIKMASPSKGRLSLHDAKELAAIYAEEGATALSVLTDFQFFAGAKEYVSLVKPFGLPVLRKDFIIDHIQVQESHMLGADAVLLIAAILKYQDLLNLCEASLTFGLEPLIEVHNREEIEMAMDTPVRVIGINNRNLKDFSVDIRASLELGPLIPPRIIKISESGIRPDDLPQLSALGFDAVLVGENLVTAPDVRNRVRQFTGREGDNA